MADLRFYLTLFFRRIGWFLGISSVVTAVGVFVALNLPPVFETSARLVVESEKIPDELAASTVQTEAVEHLQIIEQRVLARDTLLDIADDLRVYGLERPAPDTIVTDLRKRIVLTIEGQSNRRNNVSATMLSITFKDRDPVVAASVVNDVVTRVLSEDVKMRTTVARQTLDFFDQEVSRLEQNLAESGAILLSFQEENREFLPENRQSRVQRVQEIERSLEEIAAEIDAFTRERARLVRVHQYVRDQQSDAYRDVQSYETRQIDALRASIATLPEGDPGIADLESRIASLAKILDTRRQPEPVGARRTAFHDRIEKMDEEITSLEEASLALIDELGEIDTISTLAPTKSAQLDSLERDHANIQTLYSQALEAKALAETGDAIETLSKGQRIAVIEQGVIPRIPSAPNRKMIAAGSGVAGVVLGLFVIALLELRKGFLRRPVDLTKRLGITPIATLPNLDTFEVGPKKKRPLLRLTLWLGLIGLLTAGGYGAIHFGYVEEAAVLTLWETITQNDLFDRVAQLMSPAVPTY